MKVVRFVPLVGEISAANAREVPGLEAVISHWTEGERTAEEWFEALNDAWGPAGFVMRRGEEALGFLVYAPPEYVPHAGRYPVGPLSEDGVVLAYVGGDARTRRYLLVRMLRDLRLRGVARAEAVASDLGAPYHASTADLLESGWKASRHGWYRGRPYTLAHADLGSVVEVGELARGIFDRVRLPGLKKAPSPGAFSTALPKAAPEEVRDQGGKTAVLMADAPRGVVARTSRTMRGGSAAGSRLASVGSSKEERSTAKPTVFVSSALSLSTTAR